MEHALLDVRVAYTLTSRRTPALETPIQPLSREHPDFITPLTESVPSLKELLRRILQETAPLPDQADREKQRRSVTGLFLRVTDPSGLRIEHVECLRIDIPANLVPKIFENVPGDPPSVTFHFHKQGAVTLQVSPSSDGSSPRIVIILRPIRR